MIISKQWLPRSIECLADYSLEKFGRDLVAGLTVGLVAIPLALAFAIASGVAPQAGLYTAVIGGFLVSALGGSKLQIGGPTGAFVVIVAGIVGKFGLGGLAQVGIMAGVLLAVMGLAGLGNAVKYIPRPVIIGFTNGIALLIASTQVKEFLGLSAPHVPSDFIGRLAVLARSLGTVHWQTVVVACCCLAIVAGLPHLTKRIPWSILALFGAAIATYALHWHIATIGTAFGGIPQGLPAFALPAFRIDQAIPLLPSALTVALLAAVESLLSATVADSMSGDRHNSNIELVAQGVANIASPLFGGIPVTGAIARTATNIRSGAATPMAGIIHAGVVLLVLLVGAPLVRFVPLAALSAVLLVVAYNMGEWRQIGGVLRSSKADIAVWFTTFALTTLADLTVAVGTGIVLAALLYIYRVGETTSVEPVTQEYIDAGEAHALQGKSIPANVSILRIHGPFLFGTTEKLGAATRDVGELRDIVILRLRNMTALDATGIHAIEVLNERLRKSGKRLLVCGVRAQPKTLLFRSGLVDRLGADNVLPDIESALCRVDQLTRPLKADARPIFVS